ncbi:MAG TPA: gamma-glutamylcyclotransferase [Ktedonobacteraceae bacterium]|jgi:cation transport regulator ChaC
MEEKKKTSEDATGNGQEASADTHYVAPGVPIVRTSTPRPGPFFIPAKTELPLAPSAPGADFPAQPPEAPPLPEDGEHAERAQGEGKALSPPAPDAGPPAGDFLWLFEYALDMDPVQLNRADRLHGAAFAYGPALLQGYQLAFEGLDAQGHVIASLAAAPEELPDAGTWGILYRVPRRLTRAEAGEVSLLERAHGAGIFVAQEVRVREPHRQRDVSCLTYVAARDTRQQVEQLPAHARVPQLAYLKRLLQVARRQNLPTSYLETLERLLPLSMPAGAAIATEQDAEPLLAVPAFGKLRTKVAQAPSEESSGSRSSLAHTERWLVAFVLYLAALLLCTLMLAVLQGLAFWPGVFNDAFTPLGVPWYVLLYGLLGGCMSCLILLNRLAGSPPGFVVLTWFLRPFLGAVLAAFAYLLLTGGSILLSTRPAQHFALCALAGALAGLSEGKILPGRWRASA